VVVGGGVSNVRMPDGIRRDQFLAWVEQLEDRTTPDWLGLPNNAERVLLANRGTGIPFHFACLSTTGIFCLSKKNNSTDTIRFRHGSGTGSFFGQVTIRTYIILSPKCTTVISILEAIFEDYL
jgi:hypothetical protein